MDGLHIADSSVVMRVLRGPQRRLADIETSSVMLPVTHKGQRRQLCEALIILQVVFHAVALTLKSAGGRFKRVWTFGTGTST